MARFGLFGKMTAHPGQRDALLALLMEGTADLPGCDLYVVNTSVDEPDGIWIYEAWQSEADHAASLKDERVREVINRAMPLIAGFGDQVKLQPVFGKGLSTNLAD
jgi:quinol monooxygenase YgiN